jgi:hypothetical protein
MAVDRAIMAGTETSSRKFFFGPERCDFNFKLFKGNEIAQAKPIFQNRRSLINIRILEGVIAPSAHQRDFGSI